MLLKSYRKEIFRPECNSRFHSLHCFVHLDQDISEVLPFLNAMLGGSGYTIDPPSVLLKAGGKLIAVHGRKIAINALKDEDEADKIISWLQQEINDAWEKRGEIHPCCTVPAKPLVVEVLKLLPKTNCGKCGQPTCIVFSSLVVKGVKSPNDCPTITEHNNKQLTSYLSRFQFTL